LEFDWTTFLLEIGNFLILIWVLQRFLYRPVQDAIRRRQEAIDQALSRARDAQVEGERLKDHYEHRLAEWEREKEEAGALLAKEIDVERARKMETLRTELTQEQERSRVLEDRRAEELRRRIEEEAGSRAAQFGARLLGRLASPDLEARIIDVFIEDLCGLSNGKREALKAACRENGARVAVNSAFPVRTEQRSILTTTLCELADATVPCDFAEDRTLLAGLHVLIGPWVLRANLRDELSFFTETSRGWQD
jgi:F-type H+-transporting ATPase subunit b